MLGAQGRVSARRGDPACVLHLGARAASAGSRTACGSRPRSGLRWPQSRPALFVVQIVHGNYVAGTVLDSLWLGAGLLLVYAAWQPHDEPLPVKLEGSRRLTATSSARPLRSPSLVVGQFLLGRLRRRDARGRRARRADRARRGLVQGVAADVRRRARRGADRLAHRARQPAQADDGPAARAAGRERRSRRACWCCSTSTASSATTTPTATRPATSCWRGSAPTSAARSALRRRLPDRRRRVLRAVMTGASSAKTIIALARRRAVRAGRGLRDQGLARRRDPAARGARRHAGAARSPTSACTRTRRTGAPRRPARRATSCSRS